MTFIHQHLEEVDSTNNALWELSEKVQLTEFHTISSDYQWSGRGQDKNTWYSSKGQNILFSLMVFPEFLDAGEVFQISRWVSLSIVDFLKYHKVKDLSIKWPNDIYVGKKKIAGILIQNAVSGSNLSKSLIGIGLNLNEKIFPDNLPNPVSIFQLLNQDLMVLEEMYHLINILKRNYELLKKSPQKVIKQYHTRLFQLDKWTNYQVYNKIIEARIARVDEFGRLGLEKRTGEILHCDLKEVKFIL